MSKSKLSTAEQFKLDMSGVVEAWEKDQDEFYNEIVANIRSNPVMNSESAYGRFANGLNYENLPHRVYYYIFRILNKSKGTVHATSTDDIYKLLAPYSSSMKKGEKFEEWVIEQLGIDGNLLSLIAEKLGLTLIPTGSKHEREDFELTKKYTLDAKYSETRDPTNIARYRNIVKEFGYNLYTAIHQIEDNIIRSLYSGGAGAGAIHGAQGKAHALYTLTNNANKTKKIFKELPTTTNKSGHRKILIYLYPEDGYWASVCLQHVIDWAAKRLDDTKWKNANTKAGEKASDNTLRTFQGFWYGK